METQLEYKLFESEITQENKPEHIWYVKPISSFTYYIYIYRFIIVLLTNILFVLGVGVKPLTFTNRNIKRLVYCQHEWWSLSFWERANVRNVRLHYPYRQYTQPFYISICISILCTRSTLRLSNFGSVRFDIFEEYKYLHFLRQK